MQWYLSMCFSSFQGLVILSGSAKSLLMVARLRLLLRGRCQSKWKSRTPYPHRIARWKNPSKALMVAVFHPQHPRLPRCHLLHQRHRNKSIGNLLLGKYIFLVGVLVVVVSVQCVNPSFQIKLIDIGAI